MANDTFKRLIAECRELGMTARRDAFSGTAIQVFPKGQPDHPANYETDATDFEDAYNTAWCIAAFERGQPVNSPFEAEVVAEWRAVRS